MNDNLWNFDKIQDNEFEDLKINEIDTVGQDGWGLELKEGTGTDDWGPQWRGLQQEKK